MKLIIEGMSCNHCKMRVEKALSSIEGVKKARVDLDDGSAVVESSVELDREFLREVIDEAGYLLKEIKD